MVEETNWREQFEIEMKFIDRLEGNPYRHDLLCELIDLYDSWEENSYKQRLIERVKNLLDKHEDKPYWHELIERAKNFHGYLESYIEEAKKNEAYFAGLQGLCEQIDVDIDRFGLSEEQSIKMIFKRVYTFAIRSSGDFKRFEESSLLYTNVFEACFFTSLCMFIHHTKLVHGLSQREFIYNNSSKRFNKKDSENYFDYNKKNPDKHPENAVEYQCLVEEEERFRQMKRRLLQLRNVNIERPEWSTMPSSSEHEWAFYYILENLSKECKDTYKRLGNLNNDIIKVFNSQRDEDYQKRAVNAFKRFTSKLKKIKYEKVIELKREILTHICGDKTYYGMNIYRFEKELRLYYITNEVNLLLECEDSEKENHIMEKSIILNDLHYPKLYQDFSSFDDLKYTDECVRRFYAFRNVVVSSSRLVYDSLIDIDCLGKDWKSLFLNTINDMTENVFYSLDEIDFTVKSELQEASQEAFMNILSAPVNQMFNKYRSLSIPTDDEV